MSAFGSSNMTYGSALDNETIASSGSTNETMVETVEKVRVLKQNHTRYCFIRQTSVFFERTVSRFGPETSRRL